ncbi:MAG: chemotaxis protein CheW [Methylovulum sp.]|jgi:purine-binding chemotaxis protein CheW|nr:chemotaxis protein CheW [Methylovulum sp.]MCF7999139.1 chemotaxis protein CheW [Methylovulum sp.]
MINLAIEGKRTETALVSGDRYQQYLTFLVGKDIFGINILDVKEIIEINNITRIPKTPDYIRGVINLRGNVVPVIDLSARLERQCSEITKLSCIVLIEVDVHGESQVIGALVDQVNEILDIAESNIQPTPDFGTDIRTDFIQAMGRVEENFIILLAINRILSIDELSQLQRVASSHANLALSDETSNFKKMDNSDEH